MNKEDMTSKGARTAFMLCNEAIVRGALEADVKLYAAYPGSPTTEILDTFAEVGKAMDVKVEISSNEKVALETAAGAAMAGLRSMCSMKSVGMNVASDSFFSLSYTGVKGGMVIVMADDPFAHSSQSEQDGRFFGPAAYVPMLEPSDPQEAKEMVKHAFDLSERHGVPVLLRTVTRVNHQSGIVELEELKRTPFRKVPWPHEPTRFITVANRARAFKQKMLERTKSLQREFEGSPFNKVTTGEGKREGMVEGEREAKGQWAREGTVEGEREGKGRWGLEGKGEVAREGTVEGEREGKGRWGLEGKEEVAREGTVEGERESRGEKEALHSSNDEGAPQPARAIHGTGIIAASAGYNYAVEACRILGLNLPILKLGTTFPLPLNLISEFILPLKRLVVVEELSPFLESRIQALAKTVNPGLELIGKEAGYFSEALEYNPNIVATALAKAFSVRLPVKYDLVLERAEKLKEGLPLRPPTFCPGCPHRGTLYAVRKALKGVKHVVATDIGCYSMAPLEPLNYGDTLLSMGASLGVAQGLQHCVEEPVIALIGDSTFLHAGLPGLVNAIHNRASFKLVILDNAVTAMTGQQHNPSSPHEEGEAGQQRIDLEALLKGLGVEDLTVIDPYQIKDAPARFKEVFSRPGIGVVVSRRDCALYGDRNKRRKGVPIVPNQVDGQACKRIHACIKEFHCPSISVDEDRQATISRELCDGCMKCAKLCPITAIKTTGGAAGGGPAGDRRPPRPGGPGSDGTEVLREGAGKGGGA